MTDLVTLVRIKAVQSDGERWIEGYATTSQEDRVGDVVEPRGAKFTLPIPLLFQHKHDEPIGAVTHATVSDKGIRIRARLSVGVARAEEIWTLVKDGVLTAVSIGFRVLDQKPHGSRGLRITSWEWLETSVVSVPANPGALISVAKCMAMDAKELGSRTQIVTARHWTKGIETKGGIDARVIWDSATESAKKWVKTNLKEKPTALPQLAGLLAKLAQGLAISTLGRVIDLERRLDALEGYVPADGEAFSEIAKCMERLDQMEAQLSEGTLRYRGYWREGMKCNRNEAVTENGSLWIAIRSTDEKPGHNPGSDWCLAARKGKDAI